jgi:hypothetical protein
MAFYGIEFEGQEQEQEQETMEAEQNTTGNLLPNLPSQVTPVHQRAPIMREQRKTWYAEQHERIQEEQHLESIRMQRESYLKDRLKRCNGQPEKLKVLLTRFTSNEDRKILRKCAGYDIYNMLPVWEELEIGEEGWELDTNEGGGEIVHAEGWEEERFAKKQMHV